MVGTIGKHGFSVTTNEAKSKRLRLHISSLACTVVWRTLAHRSRKNSAAERGAVDRRKYLVTCRSPFQRTGSMETEP